MTTAIVTGGTRGIGRAIVESYLSDDWNVYTIARGVQDISHERLAHYRSDLSTLNGINDATLWIVTHVTQVDVLINGAGAIADQETVMGVTADTLEASWKLHALAPFMLAQGLVPLLEAARRPVVLNLGSIYADYCDEEVIAYGSSKRAQDYLTKSLAIALAPRIRVNGIHPGHVDTAMTTSAPTEFIDGVVKRTPMKRLQTTEEIVGLVRFLASDLASGISGAIITVDGGFLRQL